MESEYLDIDGKWGVVVSYDLYPLDEYEIRSTLMTLGIRGRNLEEAIDVLFNQDNSGLCVSSYDLKMSFIFIGNATSNDQWWDTLAHELMDHCRYAICSYYDVEPGSEDSAWLTGYLMRLVVNQIAEPCK